MLRGRPATQRWLGLETAAAGWRWAAGVAACLKGKAGDFEQLVSARGSENRGGELGRALRAGEGKEEGDGADRWARGVGGSGRERAGCASRAGASGAGPGELLGRGGERAAREKGRREWAAGLMAQEERMGAHWAEEVGRERERRQAGLG